jgi:hypothetical protein
MPFWRGVLTRMAAEHGNCERRDRNSPKCGDFADRLEPTTFALHVGLGLDYAAGRLREAPLHVLLRDSGQR